MANIWFTQQQEEEQTHTHFLVSLKSKFDEYIRIGNMRNSQTRYSMYLYLFYIGYGQKTNTNKNYSRSTQFTLSKLIHHKICIIIFFSYFKIKIFLSTDRYFLYETNIKYKIYLFVLASYLFILQRRKRMEYTHSATAAYRHI